ncbi:MAG: tetratricopeptide repeat protein [Verrucomicrobia bacterium]|nr:tetratricopeptide repeat protein [Verrucomicrobiota bacterium]
MRSETTESGRLLDLLAWLELNKKWLLYAAVAAAGVGLLLYVYSLYQEQTELKASQALIELRASARSAENAAPPSASAFMKVASDFASTDSGQRAALLAAGALFEENKYADARTQFDKFLRENGSSPLAATAAYGVAVCLDALDKTNEAIAAYQSVLNRFPNDAVAGQVKLALARLYEAGNQPEQALKIYEELTRPNDLSTWSSDAATRREYLLLKFPQLAATNAPTASATNPPAATAIVAATNAPAPKSGQP